MRIYDARESTLLDLIRDLPDHYKQIALFGHNPGLHQISNYLVPDSLSEFPTCAIAWIDFSIESWKDITARKGKLHYYDYPKNNS
jgi:phosphohistidine phosphatase